MLSANPVIILSAIFFFQSVSFIYSYIFCLIAPDRTSRMTLKANTEKRHPGLVPNLRHRVFSLLPLTMRSGVGFS